MADRRVKKTGKDSDGDITSLCGDWGKTLKADAIRQIDNSTYNYYVEESGYKSAVHTYTENGKKHLKTYADGTSKNNLDNLPNCY